MEDNTDCDDVNALNNPMGTEVCDGVDNNCDTLVDDADPAVIFDSDDVWYADADADGFGDANSTIDSCAHSDMSTTWTTVTTPTLRPVH